MPIDASIPLQAKSVEMPNRLAQLAQVAQLQGAQQQQQIYGLKLAEAQREQANQQALKDVFANNPDADLNKLAKLVMPVSPETGFKLQDRAINQAKAQQDAQKAKIDATLKQLEVGAQLMGNVRDQASLDQAREQTAQLLGPEFAAHVPQVYNPQQISDLRLRGMQLKDQLTAQQAKYQDAGGTLIQTNPLSSAGNITKTATIGEAESGRHNLAAEANAAANTRIAGGQLGVAQAGLTLRQQEAAQGKWTYDADRGGLVNQQTGEFKPATQSGVPIGPKGDNKEAMANKAKVTDAKDVIGLLDQAEPLIKTATSSYVGKGFDEAARAFGVSTQGAQSTAQLESLEGALISKMPKMSGPQSDRDVLLYRQMAGKIGDPTIPVETRLAAVKTIRQINEKYAGVSGAEPAAKKGGASGGWSIQRID